MNNKFGFSIVVVLCIISFSASLFSGIKLGQLVTEYAAVLSSLVLLKQKHNSLK